MAASLRVGEVIADKYRIERQIGSGGMGVVALATHLQLDQPVALKFLLEGALEHDIATERFLREARATFRLRSEHTVRVMDVGRLPTGEPFIVMEYLEGKDFKDLLKQRGPLPPAEAVLYIIQACNSLQEAHAFGIVHRDFKARNVFVTSRVDGTPCVKVLDFGISKLDAGDAAPLTRPDMGMGSPRYMAPEQWTSASTVDKRADVYAAGAVLYELLTGQQPLAGLQLVEVFKRVRAGAVPSPKEIRPDLSEALCRVVMKAMRPRPEERYQTAAELADALRAAVPEAEGGRGHGRNPPQATLPTAVVNRDVLMAQAAIEAHFAARASAPTADDRPAVSSAAPPTEPMPGAGGFDDNVATIVQKPAQAPVEAPSPYADAMAQHATLQVAQAPPEIQALRQRIGRPLPSLFETQSSVMPAPPLPPAAPVPITAPEPAPAPKSGGGWLFWILLVVSFCVAGGVVAMLAQRYLR